MPRLLLERSLGLDAIILVPLGRRSHYPWFLPCSLQLNQGIQVVLHLNQVSLNFSLLPGLGLRGACQYYQPGDQLKGPKVSWVTPCFMMLPILILALLKTTDVADS